MLITIFWACFFIVILEVFLKFTFKKLVDWLILPLIILGIVINTVMAIYEGNDILISVGYSIIGLILGILWCIVPNFIRNVGKGDSKYFIFIGSFMGPVFVLWTGMFSFVLGSLLTVLYYFYRKIFNIPDYSKIKIPFGFSILIALIITAYFQGLFISS